MINLNDTYCTYRSVHSTGFYYLGKGRTARVHSGEYKGSGVRFQLSLSLDIFAYSTWTTEILETFATEAEAYAAEAVLVPIELLSDPYCVNMTAGGQRGKYQTHGALYKRFQSAKRAAARKVKMDKAREKKSIEAAKTRALRAALRGKKATDKINKTNNKQDPHGKN